MTTFIKYSSSVIRRQFKNLFPTTGEFNLNTTSKRIDFNLDYGDLFAASGWEYSLNASLVNTDGTAYQATTGKNIEISDNFVPFLFSRIELKINNQIADEADYPGITSTVKSVVSCNQSDAYTLKNNCFFMDKGTLSANVTGKVSHLGLGFCDFPTPLPRGMVTLTFLRTGDNDAIYSDDTKPIKLVISDFIIRVPLLDYEPLAKTQLVEELLHTPNIYSFLKWTTIQKHDVFGSAWIFDATTLYTGSGIPLFIIVSFQKGREDNLASSARKFHTVNVRNVKVKLNDLLYPEEDLKLSFKNERYSLAYEMYKDFRIVNYYDSDVLMDPALFKKCPIFVIDTTDHSKPLTFSQTNIVIKADFEEPIKEKGVTPYDTFVHSSSFSHDILRNTITHLVQKSH